MTEENTDQCTEDAEYYNQKCRYNSKINRLCNCKGFSVAPHGCRKSGCNQRSAHTWNKGSVLHSTDGSHLHGKDNCGKWCSEDCGKSSTHTTHYDEACIVFVQTEPTSQLIPNTSTQLQGSTFTACRATKQMRCNRSNKNQWCHTEWDLRFCMQRGNDQIGSFIIFIITYLIKKNKSKSGKW